MKILLISDIHANFSALSAIANLFPSKQYDYIINPGDSLVYGPHPNETVDWLRKNGAISILGNTDKKVLRLLKGKTFKKPSKPEKRIMYHITAKLLSKKNIKYLKKLAESHQLKLNIKDPASSKSPTLGIYHGSPDNPDEFLFPNTPDQRFMQLAKTVKEDIIITGHSHTPYYKNIGGKIFINPGSVGRMFDSDPRSSFAEIIIEDSTVHVHHHRISYPFADLTDRLEELELPEIYSKMFKSGRKLN